MHLEFVDTTEATRRLSLSESYLEKPRMGDDGPPFVRIGRAVRYAADLEIWAQAHAVEGRRHG